MRQLRYWASLLFVLTIVWLLFLVLSMVRTGPVNTAQQALQSVVDPGILYYANYINAVLITLAATGMLAQLYMHCRPLHAEMALVGLLFVPVYCSLNLVVYCSQITVVPRLVSAMQQAENPEVYEVLLAQLIHWPASMTFEANLLAYAMLAIPSIIFGSLLAVHRKAVAGGALLVLNGVACVAAIVGVVAGLQVLVAGSVVGGVLFLFSLPLIVVGLERSGRLPVPGTPVET